MTEPETVKRRRRRGPRQPRQFDASVPSPCLSVCTFDGEPFCRGCYRNADEIRDWMIMTREQKLAVLEMLDARRAKETGETLW